MLGPLEACHDGALVPLGDQQQRFVLVVLLLHANRPVSTERFTEIVWNGNPERRHLVRGYINKLRKAFQDSDVEIETTATGYVLRVTDDQVDTFRFDRLCSEARQADDPRRAIELLRTAVGLWRGRYLEDIDIDRVGGTEVISPEDSYFDAVGDLAELELNTGDHRSARDRLRRVVQFDPARQKHAGLLMRALIADGARVEAIRVFHTTSEALRGIDLEPGPQLRNLAARAERGEPPSSLPSRPGVFTGRDTELALIERTAAAGGRAVWISGPPGAGKTGLAIESAHRLRDRFSDGQLLVRLGGFTPNVPATTIGDALTQALTDLGVPAEQIPATVGRKVTLYQTELYGTRTLLVLDNAASADQVRPLLPQAPGCLAIVTSRKMGEPDTGENVRLAPMPPEEGAALFRALTDPARVRGRSAEVDEIARRCGHLPMPIHVAAALFRRHHRWPLDHLLRLLEQNGPDSAAVRASYQQLGAPQRYLFRLLGHLPGPDIDVTGAAALAGRDVTGVRGALDELHQVSLLEEISPERYQMLDPLKEFAAAEPPATPAEPSDALVRLLDFYLVTLAAAVSTAYPFDRAQLPATDRASPVAPVFAGADAALQWIATEQKNLVAAVRAAATHGLPEHAWRLAVLIWRHFNTTSQFEDWIETMELAWEVVSANPDNDYGQAHVLLRLATANDRLGRLTEALELAAKALPRWIRLGDVRGEAATLCAIAIPTMELGEHDRAMAHLSAALDKYRQCDDPRGQAHALSMLGYLNELHGNLDDALRRHEAAVPMLREIGHVQGAAHALNNLGSVQQRLGLLDDALRSHTEAHGHATEVGDLCAAAYALTNLGNVHRRHGRLTEAVRYQERAKQVAADVSDADLRTQLYLDRGATAHAGQDDAEALRSYLAALDLAAGTGNRAHQARAHHGIAATLHRTGHHDRAASHWDSAQTEFATLGLPEASVVSSEREALACQCRRTTRFSSG
ncbi:tetratricopeptide repeat protein [Amycolatopsis suaedae]|uniref:Tetratricopeptide repeat protein n=2 Tax=Amycolatopsis suaedae TaxID=2510978 RepID=A0A4Q7JBI7_9PSEU|nr:tetratricopeptide repeat protein [Amycolatopsis suaedae]